MQARLDEIGRSLGDAFRRLLSPLQRARRAAAAARGGDYTRPGSGGGLPVEPFPFGELPVELRAHVLTFVDVRTVCAVAATCRQYRALQDIDGIWKALCARAFAEWIPEPAPVCWKAFYRDVAYINRCCQGKLIDEERMRARMLDKHGHLRWPAQRIRPFFEHVRDTLHVVLTILARATENRSVQQVQHVLRLLRVQAHGNDAVAFGVAVERLEEHVASLLQLQQPINSADGGDTPEPRQAQQRDERQQHDERQEQLPTAGRNVDADLVRWDEVWPPHSLALLNKTFELSVAATDKLLTRHGC